MSATFSRLCRPCWFFSSQMARWNSKQTQTVVHIRARGERVFLEFWSCSLLFALCSLLPFPFPAIDTGIPCCINTFPHSLPCNPCSALIPRQPAHQAKLPWTAKIEEDSFRSESLERTLQTLYFPNYKPRNRCRGCLFRGRECWRTGGFHVSHFFPLSVMWLRQVSKPLPERQEDSHEYLVI